MQQVKHQIYAHLTLNGQNVKTWAQAKNYNPDTVRRVVTRYSSGKRFWKGTESEQIINDLLKMIGSETIN